MLARVRSSSRSAALLATSFAALLAAVAPARANIAAPQPPTALSSPGPVAAPTPLAVDAADLVVDCTVGPGCRLEVTYRLRNPSDAAAGGTAAFYAFDTDDVTIEVNGRSAGKHVDAAEADAFDAAVTAAGGGEPGAAPPLERHGQAVARHGFAVELAPQATATVVVVGHLPVHRRHGYYMVVPGPAARHRLYQRGEPGARWIELDYLITPIRTWGTAPATMSFTLRAPGAWPVTVDGVDQLGTEPSAGAVTITRGVLATTADTFRLRLDLPAERPLHAGVLLGVGGNVDDATGLRLRAGVELGLREAWLVSLAYEHEGEGGGSVLVPAVAYSTPWAIVVPSLGVGLGAPVRLGSSLEVGARGLVDLHLGPLGFVTTFDYYPGMAAGARRFEVAMFGQLAL